MDQISRLLVFGKYKPDFVYGKRGWKKGKVGEKVYPDWEEKMKGKTRSRSRRNGSLFVRCGFPMKDRGGLPQRL